MKRAKDFEELLKLVSTIGGIAASFQDAPQRQVPIQGPARGVVMKDAVVLAIRDEEDDPEDP